MGGSGLTEITRIGVSIPSGLLKELDRIVEELDVPSRSKAISEAIAQYIGDRAWLLEGGEDYQVVGSITLMYRHDEASESITEIQHRFIDIIRSTSHVHLSVGRCLEVTILAGPVSKARELVKTLHSVRGVEAIRASVFPVGGEEVGHTHG